MGCQFHAILICYLDVKPHKSILNSQAEQKLLLLQDRTAEFSMTWKALNMDFYCYTVWRKMEFLPTEWREQGYFTTVEQVYVLSGVYTATQ